MYVLSVVLCNLRVINVSCDQSSHQMGAGREKEGKNGIYQLLIAKAGSAVWGFIRSG